MTIHTDPSDIANEILSETSIGVADLDQNSSEVTAAAKAFGIDLDDEGQRTTCLRLINMIMTGSLVDENQDVVDKTLAILIHNHSPQAIEMAAQLARQCYGVMHATTSLAAGIGNKQKVAG